MPDLDIRCEHVVAPALHEVHEFVVERYFANHHRWDPAVVAMEQRGTGPVRVGTVGVETRRFLGRQRAAFAVTACGPDVLSLTNTSGPFRLDRTYRLVPEAAGTRLTFTFRMSPKPLVRPVFPLVRRTIAGQVRANIDRLAGLLDAAGSA